jgi:hypothetical protein
VGVIVPKEGGSIYKTTRLGPRSDVVKDNKSRDLEVRAARSEVLVQKFPPVQQSHNEVTLWQPKM